MEANTDREKYRSSNMKCVPMFVDTVRSFYSDTTVSFFFVYLLLTVVIGLPAFYMEFALGQFSSRSAIHVWKFAPIFAGEFRCWVQL